MNEIEKSRTEEIKDLHGKFVEVYKKTLDYGIRIGELLKQQKSDLKHGQFGPWIEENLPFTIRTAQSYMKLYRERDWLKSETVSHLTDAYRLLTEPKPLDPREKTIHCYANCINEVREETGCSWQTALDAMVKKTGFPRNVLLNWHYLFFGVVSDELIPEPITDEEINQLMDALEQILLKVEKDIKEGRITKEELEGA